RRYVDEIARTGFGYELQPFPPSHTGFAADHVNDTLELPVMMRACLGIGLYAYPACPSLLGSHPRVIDCSLTLHARRLRRVGIKRRRGNDPHAIVLPFGRVLVIMRVRHENPPENSAIAAGAKTGGRPFTNARVRLLAKIALTSNSRLRPTLLLTLVHPLFIRIILLRPSLRSYGGI